ncbi:SET and MYND domain-containing protein 4-like [Tribolium madens]|uniref:SET and MYND domain-containing protein 4-like n=1 Tax=Tribolium madens TaxID=41895 RepID=UPI001CF72A28|nr:SET and MYND domain-containing protein 4-like [Tribolium madens]
MDCLVAYYSELFKPIDGNVFENFSKFYDADLTRIYSWLENQFKNKTVKNNTISALHRREGNNFYAEKNLIKSFDCYTKSLRFAIPYSKEYGLALANRSAVSFELKEYHNCLKDIELCFKSNYPTDLKPKIYIRKAECYYELNEKESLNQCISEVFHFLETENVVEKDKFIKRLNHIKKLKNTKPKIESGQECLHEIPVFPDGENQCLAYASTKVKMSYNKDKGRHIVASTDINRGELLFIEKAFVFAPVFKENKEFYSFKCYNCLNDIVSGVPCNSCTVCVYCDENCRDKSWKKCHRWECDGMQANIWFDLGIALPAFKVMLEGAATGFRSLEGGFEDDLKCFGDKDDNYRYFNRLLSNIYKNKNVAPYIVMATIVVSYLRKYTDFFTWFLKQPNCPKKDFDNLVKLVGGLITKHIAQLACNSSTIEQWTCSSSDLLFPDVLITIASGIFPSVSIMNHSCRPNVTNYFMCDTIVVKALEDIAQNEEIFNCYGIDYRGMEREQRQYACKELYHFECKCVICSDPAHELDMLDSYLCPKCKGLVPEINNTILSFCVNCGEKYHLKPFRKINNEAQKYMESDSSNQLELLIKSLKIREKILYKHHKDFEEVYYRLYSFYVKHGDAENMFKYFHLWLENEKARRGSNSRVVGTKLYEAALAILHCLKGGQQKNCTNLKDFLQNVEYMIKEAKAILNLYYPAFITNRLNKKIQFISTK